MARGTPLSPSVSTKDWTLHGLLREGKRFQEVPRISASSPHLIERIKAFEMDGIPLVIEDWHKETNWPTAMFSVDWLMAHFGDDSITARNVLDRSDKKLSLQRFIDQSRAQSRTGERGDELLYGKDAPCPRQWSHWVSHGDVLPASIRPGASNDLFQHLGDTEAVESLMCYLGIRDTFTPAHKDLCASSGQNIMCYTEDDGSSFWFMTESKDAPDVESFFSTHIRKELDWEDHVTTVQEFAQAPFTVYITEQKLGDLVLVPPRSCHQVVNHGGLTIKTSWSRMTVDGLSVALYHELPMYRRVCRPEQYRIKHILYRSLIHYTAEIKTIRFRNAPGPAADTLRNLTNDLQALLSLFDFVLHEEYTDDHKLLYHVSEKTHHTIARTSPRTSIQLQPNATLVLRPPNGHSSLQNEDPLDPACNLMCDFCGADIFQSFFECRDCGPEFVERWGTGNGLLICPFCYVEGRTCACGSMEPSQCRPFEQLIRARNDAQVVLKKSPYCDVDIQPVDEKQLLSLQGISTFHAGCLLQRRRVRADNMRVANRRCSVKRISHDVPYHQIVSCNPCHRSTCFKHLLKYGMHSSEILPVMHEGQESWHQYHQTKKIDAFRAGKGVVRVTERSGSAPNYAYKLAALAQTYARCRPINSAVSKGFYDILPEEVVDINADEQHPVHSDFDALLDIDVTAMSTTRGTALQASWAPGKGTNAQLNAYIQTTSTLRLAGMSSSDPSMSSSVSKASVEHAIFDGVCVRTASHNRKRPSTHHQSSSNKRTKLGQDHIEVHSPSNMTLIDVLNKDMRDTQNASLPSNIGTQKRRGVIPSTSDSDSDDDEPLAAPPSTVPATTHKQKSVSRQARSNWESSKLSATQESHKKVSSRPDPAVFSTAATLAASIFDDAAEQSVPLHSKIRKRHGPPGVRPTDIQSSMNLVETDAYAFDVIGTSKGKLRAAAIEHPEPLNQDSDELHARQYVTTEMLEKMQNELAALRGEVHDLRRRERNFEIERNQHKADQVSWTKDRETLKNQLDALKAKHSTELESVRADIRSLRVEVKQGKLTDKDNAAFMHVQDIHSEQARLHQELETQKSQVTQLWGLQDQVYRLQPAVFEQFEHRFKQSLDQVMEETVCELVRMMDDFKEVIPANLILQQPSAAKRIGVVLRKVFEKCLAKSDPEANGVQVAPGRHTGPRDHEERTQNIVVKDNIPPAFHKRQHSYQHPKPVPDGFEQNNNFAVNGQPRHRQHQNFSGGTYQTRYPRQQQQGNGYGNIQRQFNLRQHGYDQPERVNQHPPNVNSLKHRIGGTRWDKQHVPRDHAQMKQDGHMQLEHLQPQRAPKNTVHSDAESPDARAIARSPSRGEQDWELGYDQDANEPEAQLQRAGKERRDLLAEGQRDCGSGSSSSCEGSNQSDPGLSPAS
ncbi:unnamed protein product [Somion occarium]|uniref:JmjC domain-containing protein n=2 Tax=Somion occarium TaxID=3059160 RepID=A0ABP1DA35_9APHY